MVDFPIPFGPTTAKKNVNLASERYQGTNYLARFGTKQKFTNINFVQLLRSGKHMEKRQNPNTDLHFFFYGPYKLNESTILLVYKTELNEKLLKNYKKNAENQNLLATRLSRSIPKFKFLKSIGPPG